MTPPDLPRNAPRLDVLHPIEERRFPLCWHEHGAARAHRFDRRLRERLGVDVPLIGEIRLDDRPDGRRAARCESSVRSFRADRGPQGVQQFSCAPRSDQAHASIASRRVPTSAVPRAGRRRCHRRSSLPSTSSTLTSGKLCRLPTSKSLKSCAGVIFTAPEPFSGSAYSSAMIGMRRPTSGKIAVLPIRCFSRSFCG